MSLKSCLIIVTICLQIFLKVNAINYNQAQKSLIEMSVDPLIDPCEDFYGYACNNYYQQHQDTEYQEITSLIDYEVNKKLLNLLETKHKSVDHTEDNVEQMIRTYYEACHNEKQRNVTKYFEDIKPAEKLNWPLLEEIKMEDSKCFKWQQEEKFDFLDLLGKLQSYGLNDVIINQEIKVTKNGLYKIMLEPAYFDEEGLIENLLKAFLMFLGLKEEKIIKFVKEIKLVEELLSEIQQSYTEIDDSKEVLYQDLLKEYPNLNLTLYIQNLISSNPSEIKSVTINYPKYFQYLNDNLWKNIEKQQLCNYLMFKFFIYLATDSTTDFSELNCINDLRNKMDLAVNFVYYNNFYKYEEQKYNTEISEMVDKIVKTMNKLFEYNNLNLTVTQKQTLKDKLFKIKVKKGNLPTNFSQQQIEKFYGNVLPLDRGNYYKNHLKLLKNRFAKSLHYPQNQTYFITSDNRLGSSSAPIYIIQQNMILVPYGSLQFPIFDTSYNSLYKWSILGFLLAHEFTHAFDTTGLNFDEQGLPLPVNSDIMNNPNFASARVCMQNQQPTDAIDERIADLFALPVVYKVFVENCSHITQWRRAFFLSLAQFFCGKANTKFVDHDADSIRLQQIVMNSEHFSEAFRCLEGSKMNPKVKCRLY